MCNKQVIQLRGTILKKNKRKEGVMGLSVIRLAFNGVNMTFPIVIYFLFLLFFRFPWKYWEIFIFFGLLFSVYRSTLSYVNHNNVYSPYLRVNNLLKETFYRRLFLFGFKLAANGWEWTEKEEREKKWQLSWC